MEAINKILDKKNQSRSFTGEILSEYECSGCQQQVQETKFVIPFGPEKGKTFIGKQGCKCQDIALGLQALEERKQAELEKIQDVFDSHSLMNTDLQNASFENYKVKNQQEFEAKKIAMEFVQSFDKKNPRNLMFYGPPQVGKSHLAVSITKALAEKRITSIFINVPKLLTKIRSTYNSKASHSQEELLNMLRDVDLLVIDDLGAEKNQDQTRKAWSDGILWELIDDRQGKHTIYTSNLTDEGLEGFYDLRTLKRIYKRTDTFLLGA